MGKRTANQELNFLAQMNRINRSHMALFAYTGVVTINRGRVYRYAGQIGISNLEITTALGRELAHLKRVANLADTYGRSNATEFTHAAWLALACFGMRLATIVASIESDELMLKNLGPTGRFARALVEWRRLVASGEPPPAESVALQMARHFGIIIDESNTADICHDLTDAFPSQLVDAKQISPVVAQHCGATVTPELANNIAEDAVKLVRALGVAPNTTVVN